MSWKTTIPKNMLLFAKSGSRNVFLATSIFVIGAHAHVHAQAGVKWSLSGFGTLAGVHSTDDQADYTASPVSLGRAGHSKRWAFDVDSRLGIQLDAQLNKQWSAVVQVVQEKGVSQSYETQLEWINVKYQVTPELSVRFGRIALPLFLAADYRKATYALPWVRTPVELYSLLPISSNDGIDAIYRWNAFGVKHETQVTAGFATVQLTPEVSGKSRNAYAITHKVQTGDLTVRATAASSILNIGGAEQFFEAFRGFGPRGAALANRYDIASRRLHIFSVGVNYEANDWLLMGEIGRVNTRSMLGDQTAGYLSSGYHLGSVMPYVTVSRVDVNMDTHTEGLSLAGLPQQAAETAQLLNGALNAQLRSIGVQDSVSAGLRWDVAPGYAIKLQLDRVKPRGGSNGTLTKVQPNFRSGRAFGVASVGIDFVF